MTRPALVWYMVSRTALLLGRWVGWAVLFGVCAAFLGTNVFVLVVGFAGWKVWNRRPVPEPVIVDISEERYRQHLARVMSSLDGIEAVAREDPRSGTTGDGPAPRAISRQSPVIVDLSETGSYT